MRPEYKIQNNVKVHSFMSAFEVIYNDDFFFNGENHNFWECVYVMDGKAGATADERIHELSENEIIFHKPMEFHKLWASSGTKPHLFIMSFRCEGECMDQFRNSVFHLTAEQKTALEQLLHLFRKQTERNPSALSTNEYLKTWYDNPILTQMAGNYLEIFLLSLANSQKIPPTVRQSKNAVLYQQIIRLMEQHIYDWITIGQLASELNMSISNLKKVFSKYSTYSLHKYFLKLKINRAAELLKSGYSILEVSETLSFNNQNYFSMVFKRETGYSPMRYKARFLAPERL